VQERRRLAWLLRRERNKRKRVKSGIDDGASRLSQALFDSGVLGFCPVTPYIYCSFRLSRPQSPSVSVPGCESVYRLLVFPAPCGVCIDCW
jgi:hypothetical protein